MCLQYISDYERNVIPNRASVKSMIEAIKVGNKCKVYTYMFMYILSYCDSDRMIVMIRCFLRGKYTNLLL